MKIEYCIDLKGLQQGQLIPVGTELVGDFRLSSPNQWGRLTTKPGDRAWLYQSEWMGCHYPSIQVLPVDTEFRHHPIDGRLYAVYPVTHRNGVVREEWEYLPGGRKHPAVRAFRFRNRMSRRSA